MNDVELLALHREIVGIPSISRDERAVADHLESFLKMQGCGVERIGHNLLVAEGEGPAVCLNSHFDTVPPMPGWTRPPHQVEVIDGRVYGLGSNDAKASVAAMIAAFLRLKQRGGPPLVLALACEEETGGEGSERLVQELLRRRTALTAAIVGEPTALDVTVAQKGLLILELVTEGRACHAAHGRALKAPNALRQLALDLVALDRVELRDHPALGPVTLEPTVASGGTIRNAIPAEARCVIDMRTNPNQSPAEIVERLRAVVKGRLEVVSDRLGPCEIAPEHPLVRAALRARPRTELIASRGVSDWIFFQNAGIPTMKVGPGRTERSHAPDEFVLETEILEAARFYEATVREFSNG